MNYTFDTPEPVELIVEIGPGDIVVTAAATEQTTVDLAGKAAEETSVTQRGRTIEVIGPQRRGIFSGSQGVSVTVHLPEGSNLAIKTGSADLDTSGQLGRVEVKTGSGDITVETAARADCTSGSGDFRFGTVQGRLESRTGSGNVRVDSAGAVSTSSGSGDITLGQVEQEVSAKTGSGDVIVQDAGGNLTVRTASGDVEVSRMHRGVAEIKAASGNLRLGAQQGVPVWTDASSVSGRVTSTLQSLGQPEEGQDYLQWRLRTVSGDIYLSHV